MALALIPSKAALTVNVPKPFLGTGGTPPYTYSVLTGAGSVDVDGLYTAPSVVPAPTAPIVLRVTDSLLATADVPIAVLTPVSLIVDILQQELGLALDRVYLWDQKNFQPKDDGLYIAVAVIGSKPFGNNRGQRSVLGGLEAIQSVNMCDMVQIDLISRGTAARDRRAEALMALNSVYSEQQQELNSFRVALLSTNFTNLSEQDGAAIPYRFNITVNLQYSVVKAQSVPFYDTFQEVEVVTDP